MRITDGFPLDEPEAFKQVQEDALVVDAVQEFLAGLLHAAYKRGGLAVQGILEECLGCQQGIIVFLDIIHPFVQILETAWATPVRDSLSAGWYRLQMKSSCFLSEGKKYAQPKDLSPWEEETAHFSIPGLRLMWQ